MANIIDILRSSNSELAKAEANDIAKWSVLKHKKEDLELLLQFNIAQIRYTTKDGEDKLMTCTSNMSLIKILNAVKKEDKKKIAITNLGGIRTKDPNSVNTFDIVSKKLKTMSLKNWTIINFISITPQNILILDEILNNI